jgi:hypothetical protein
MWEPRRLTSLWASTACYMNSFTFYLRQNLSNSHILSSSSSKTPYAVSCLLHAVYVSCSLISSLQYHFYFLFIYSHSGRETGSTRHVGHWMAYCTCPGWLWWWRIWWNKDWQGKPKYSEKTCPSATLSTTSPTCHARARTRTAEVGSQRLTAWAMARPLTISLTQRTSFLRKIFSNTNNVYPFQTEWNDYSMLKDCLLKHECWISFLK